MNSNLISALIWWIFAIIIWPIIKHILDYRLEKKKIKINLEKNEFEVLRQNIFSLISTIHNDCYEINQYIEYIKRYWEKMDNEHLKKINVSNIDPNNFWIISMYLPEISDIYLEYYQLIWKIKKTLEIHTNIRSDTKEVFDVCDVCEKKDTCESYLKKEWICTSNKIFSENLVEIRDYKDQDAISKKLIRILQWYLNKKKQF